MNFCSNCGTELSNGVQCPNCGANYEQHTLYEAEKPSMMDAYKSMWKNYANFSGRARRSEYWYVCLVNIIISFICSLGSSLISAELFLFISGAYSLATLVPGLALCVRRLHDTGKSGHVLWSMLAMIIPIVNLAVIIMLIVFYCADSDRGPNKYGESSKYYYN